MPLLKKSENTAAQWTASNPVLEDGELAVDENGRAKLGDGESRYADLGYFDPAATTVKVYRALLTQTGENAPVATVLENTLGETPTLGYIEPGAYSLTTVGNRFTNSVVIRNALLTVVQYTPLKVAQFSLAGPTQITIGTALDSDADWIVDTNSNDVLNNTPIEILVYP